MGLDFNNSASPNCCRIQWDLPRCCPDLIDSGSMRAHPSKKRLLLKGINDIFIGPKCILVSTEHLGDAGCQDFDSQDSGSPKFDYQDFGSRGFDSRDFDCPNSGLYLVHLHQPKVRQKDQNDQKLLCLLHEICKETNLHFPKKSSVRYNSILFRDV